MRLCSVNSENTLQSSERTHHSFQQRRECHCSCSEPLQTRDRNGESGCKLVGFADIAQEWPSGCVTFTKRMAYMWSSFPTVMEISILMETKLTARCVHLRMHRTALTDAITVNKLPWRIDSTDLPWPAVSHSVVQQTRQIRVDPCASTADRADQSMPARAY